MRLPIVISIDPKALHSVPSRDRYARLKCGHAALLAIPPSADRLSVTRPPAAAGQQEEDHEVSSSAMTSSSPPSRAHSTKACPDPLLRLARRGSGILPHHLEAAARFRTAWERRHKAEVRRGFMASTGV